MKHVKFTSFVGLMVVLGLLIGCSPSKIDSGSAGAVVTTGTSSASALALTASPTSITLSGSSFITAHVVDELGNNVPDGTIVTFAFAPGDQVKASLSSSQAQTVNGLATVTVTATSLSGAIATVNATSGSASASIAITITAAVAGGSVIVTTAPSTITAGNTSNVTAIIKDNNGNPVANATVNFSLNNNTLASFSQSSATTDATGVATVVLTGTAAGSVTLTASVPSLGGTSGQANVTINPASTVPTITVSSTATSIQTNGSTAISAVLSGFIPVNSLDVTFTVSNPTAAYISGPTTTGSSVTVQTNASGLASITLHANNIATPVTVTASYATQSLTGTTTITISAPPPDSVNVVANPVSITAFGTSTISATVKGAGQPVPDGTLVNFIISNGTFGSLSNVQGSTVGGVATTTFSAVSKAGSVTISATAGSTSANTTISITPASTGSIQFVSAVPQVIGLQSSGQLETSTVTFAVKDVNGNPVSDGTTVDFTMNGPGGGSYIGSTIGSQSASASTINGNASVILHSGSTAGPVTIIASTSVAGGGTISTSASQISIGGGVPSARHFNLATSKYNLPGLVVSNATADISAFIADRFGNYNVLNGTSISFYTEAGAIDRQGTTDETGKTSVSFRTQAPNPSVVKIWDSADPLDETALITYLNSAYTLGIPVGDAIHPRNGWATVLATVQGEESFLDENGNGLFTRSYGSTACPAGYTCECDDGTPNTYAGCITSQSNGPSACISASTCAVAGGSIPATSKRSEGFLDIGEPFIDVNDDGCRNDGSTRNCGGTTTASTEPFELFIDANTSGAYDPPNGKWDGPSCKTMGCQTTKMIWTTETLAFTGNASYCTFGTSAPVSITYGASQSYSFMVGDAFTNHLVAGTTVAVSVDSGTLSGQTSFPVPDGVPFGPTEIFFTLTAPTAPTAPTSCLPASPPCPVPNTPFTLTGTATSSAVVGCIVSISGTFTP